MSQAGDVLQFTTLALLVYQLTGSGVRVSFVVVAEIAPLTRRHRWQASPHDEPVEPLRTQMAS